MLSVASHTFSVVERNINRNRSRICWVLVRKVMQLHIQVNQCHKPLLVLPDSWCQFRVSNASSNWQVSWNHWHATRGPLQTINGLLDAPVWPWLRVSLLGFWKRLILTLELTSWCFSPVDPLLKAPGWSSVTSWRNLSDRIWVMKSKGIP